MSGCYVFLSRDAAPAAREAGDDGAPPEPVRRVDGERVVRTADAGFRGAVFHHGILPGSGIAESEDGRQRLLLAGACWTARRSERVATPSEALAVVLDEGFGERARFSGSYLLAHVDLRQRRVTVENPVFGLIPVYYVSTGERILVASEMGPLAPWSAREVDLDVLGEVLHFGYALSPRALLKGIHRLPPNHRLVWTRGELRIERLRLPAFPRDRRMDPAALEDLRGAFEAAIGRFAGASPRLSVSLSGGLDSRMLAAAARRLGCELTAWTVGEPGSLESRMAVRFARSIGVPIRVHEIDGSAFPDWFPEAVRITEGRCPPGSMHFLDAMIRGDYVRAPQLHGLIGDVVLGGDVDTVEKLAPDAVRGACQERVVSFVYWPRDTQAALFPPEVRAGIGRARHGAAERVLGSIDPRGDYGDYLWFRYHFRLLPFIFPALSSQVLPWTDMIVPFVDDRFFELCAGLSNADIADRSAQIRLIRRAYPEVARLPRVKDGALIPVATENVYDAAIRRVRRRQRVKELVCRASLGRVNLPRRESYPYYARWYRKWRRVRELFSDHLLAAGTDSHGLWSRGGAGTLLALLRRGHDCWDAAAGLLMVQLVLRESLSRESLPRDRDR